jgi:hypothetical protein
LTLPDNGDNVIRGIHDLPDCPGTDRGSAVRIAVLIVGLIGAGVSGLGGLLTQSLSGMEPADLGFYRRIGLPLGEEMGNSPPWWERVPAVLFYAGAGLGLFASFLALGRRRLAAAGLFFVVAAGPVVFAPPAVLFTALLAVAAVLAVFIGPAQHPEPAG